MTKWRNIDKVWCIWPSRPSMLVEIIGGSYLASSPNISYRNLIQNLEKRNIAIHAYSYLPGLDHQGLANCAWQKLRNCRRKLIIRIGYELKVIRIGHSLGSKLHLLAPDGGRNCDGLISISFNNFAANKSIPIIDKISPKLAIKTEFLPTPTETMRIVSQNYFQPRNLLIAFDDDDFDQSNKLLKCLCNREIDYSKYILLKGDHLTPANIGINGQFFRNIGTPYRIEEFNKLLEVIYNWSGIS